MSVTEHVKAPLIAYLIDRCHRRARLDCDRELLLRLPTASKQIGLLAAGQDQDIQARHQALMPTTNQQSYKMPTTKGQQLALNENDIRPDELMAGQAQRFANDVQRMLSRKSEFVDVNCPACGNAERVSKLEKYNMQFVDCTVCQTMYASPRPTPQILDYYYANSENYAYWNKFIFPASEGARKARIFAPRAERLKAVIQKYDISRKLLLEVGAGFGTFAEAVTDLDLFDRVVAIEPTPDLAQTCRNKGLEVLESPFEHVDYAEYQASVVAAFEVIEHLFDPQEFFSMAFKVLEPGGVVVVSCPNGKGFDIECMQVHASAVDVEHLNYFNPHSLSLLATSCGFDVLETSTPGQLDVDLVRKCFLAGDIDLGGNAFLKKIVVDEFDTYGQPFQQFLADNVLSGHLVLVARKPVSSLPKTPRDAA